MTEFIGRYATGQRVLSMGPISRQWAHDLGVTMRIDYPPGTHAARICPFSLNTPHLEAWYAGWRGQP